MGGFAAFEEQVRVTSDTWEVFNLHNAFLPRDPLEYVIEGLIQTSGVSITYGQPGCLKSMLLTDAMMHVAAGFSWLGRSVVQSPCLWVDFDNGRRRTHERIEAHARHLGISPTTPFYYVSMPTPMLDAGDVESMEQLKQLINNLGAKFVVIDNLGVVSPNTDENGDGMANVMSNFRRLAEDTGAHITLIHHQRKSTGTGSKGESLRGHSSITAAIDLALLITREANSDVIEIRSTKTRDVDVYPFGAEYRYEHRDGTSELYKAGFVPFEVDDKSSAEALKNGIIEIVKENRLINQTGIVEKAKALFGIGRSKTLTIIAKLEEGKALLFESGTGREKQYYID